MRRLLILRAHPAVRRRLTLSRDGRRDWNITGTGPGRVRVQPLPQFIGDQVDTDPAGPPIQVAEDALGVAQTAKNRLVLLRRLDAEQRHDAGNFGPLA